MCDVLRATHVPRFVRSAIKEESERKRRGPSDATDYSSTQAPATQKYAEGRRPHPSDERLEPGGLRGAPEDPGMGSLNPDSATVSGPGMDVGAQDDDRDQS